MAKAPEFLANMSKEYIREGLQEARHPVSIALFGTENFFNGAAIVRSAHQFLVKEVILVDCPKIYEKATMGCHKWENITHMTLGDFCYRHSIFSSMDNRPLVICERRADLPSENLMDFKYPENPILCFGNEKFGMPEEILVLAKQLKDNLGDIQPGCGSVVSIPTYGILNDLNLANAASIILYDWTLKHYRGAK